MDASRTALDRRQLERIGAVPKPQVSLNLRTQRKLLVIAMVILDCLALLMAFAAAYVVRFEIRLPIFRDVTPQMEYYAPVVAGMVLLWLILFALAGLYAEHNLLGGTKEYALVFNACSVGSLVVVASTFLVEQFGFSRGLLALSWLLTFLFVGSARFLFRRAIYRLRQRGYFLRPAVIIGCNSEGIALAEQLDSWAASGMNLLGFVDDTFPVGTMVADKFMILGTLDDLDQLVTSEGIEELVIAADGLSRERLVRIVQSYGTSSQVEIYFSTGFFEILTTGVRILERAYVPLINLNKVRLTGLDIFLKTMLDLLIAIPGLILIAPFMGVIALLVKLDSSGPVLYRRTVLGLHGREFEALKFRTMHVAWEQTAQSEGVREQFVKGVKPSDDPRVTRIGRFLRKYSLDELPQLINVLKRDMSLVGPRIITREETPFYEKWEMNLLTVRPGMTGLWQVSGRAKLTYDEKVQLDMYYIRNYTIWLDLQILLRTIPAVLKGKGAY